MPLSCICCRICFYVYHVMLAFRCSWRNWFAQPLNQNSLIKLQTVVTELHTCNELFLWCFLTGLNLLSEFNLDNLTVFSKVAPSDDFSVEVRNAPFCVYGYNVQLYIRCLSVVLSAQSIYQLVNLQKAIFQFFGVTFSLRFQVREHITHALFPV